VTLLPPPNPVVILPPDPSGEGVPAGIIVLPDRRLPARRTDMGVTRPAPLDVATLLRERRRVIDRKVRVEVAEVTELLTKPPPPPPPPPPRADGAAAVAAADGDTLMADADGATGPFGPVAAATVTVTADAGDSIDGVAAQDTSADALAAAAAEANRLAREAALLRGRLRQLKLLTLQRQLRAELRDESRGAEKDGRRGSKTRARALRGLQRECERRTRAAARAADSWERERRKVKAAWLAAVVDHSMRFRQYHRDVVRRGLRVMTKAVVKFHEDRAKTMDRAGRDQERARIQKLREDDEEGYLELVRQTKNSRLMELLNQTDSYLKELGAIVSTERANDERRDGPAGDTVGGGGDPPPKRGAERAGAPHRAGGGGSSGGRRGGGGRAASRAGGRRGGRHGRRRGAGRPQGANLL